MKCDHKRKMRGSFLPDGNRRTQSKVDSYYDRFELSTLLQI